MGRFVLYAPPRIWILYRDGLIENILKRVIRFMRYQTHVSVSLFFGAGLAKVVNFPLSIEYLTGLALGSLAPDVDEPNSWIGKRTLGVSHAIKALFGHRGVTHYPLTWSVLTTGLLLVFPGQFSVGFSIGYAAHLLGDFLSKSGIPLKGPFSKKRYKFPLYRTGDWKEAIILALSLLGFGYLMVGGGIR